MILDRIENAFRYVKLNGGFAGAFAFLSRPNLKKLPSGKYEIAGKSLYAVISRGRGQKRREGRLESHVKYTDIQLVLAGIDCMGWKPLALCKRPGGKYDPKTDTRLFADKPAAWMPVSNGEFAIFFPEDAHMPSISPGRLHKVVVKVATGLQAEKIKVPLRHNKMLPVGHSRDTFVAP